MRHRATDSTVTTARATVNYDLPQWNGEDVTSWLVNLNDAFNKIDSAMWENHTAMAGYDKIASDLQKLADDLRVDNSEIRESLETIQRGMADQLTQLNQAKQDITNANIAITQLQQEDNALSAMVKDLQDDVGMMMNWRKWHAWSPPTEMTLQIVGSDGTTCICKLISVSICNAMIQFNIKLTNSLTVAAKHTYRGEFTHEDTAVILEWLRSAYPPLEGDFGLAGIVSHVKYDVAYASTYIATYPDGTQKWRFNIYCMNDGTIPGNTMITTKEMGGAYVNA